MKKLITLLPILMAITLLFSACSDKPADINSQGNNPNSQTSQPASESEDTTKYATEMWDSAKMNGLEPPKADINSEVQDTGLVKYGFSNMKKANAEKYVEYLKKSGYTVSPVELNSTNYRAANGGYEVIFKYSTYDSDGNGSGEIQMVKK
ncbi:hypothetical protein SY88_17165 [Clostridiales bacterium PH28_bin88]|nr:hypothetical protein SY88_17165 [Clostridiales bacterium PH28_bin88]